MVNDVRLQGKPLHLVFLILFISYLPCHKSVAQTIHTCAPHLVVSALESDLTVPETRHSFTSKVIRRVLTALVHHCAKAEQFSTISEPLIDSFAENAGMSESVEKIARVLGVIAVVCGVRQGSRLTSTSNLSLNLNVMDYWLISNSETDVANS